MKSTRIIFFSLVVFTLAVYSANAGDILFETIIPWYYWWSDISWGTGGFTYIQDVAIGYLPATDQEVCTIKVGLYKLDDPTDSVTMTVRGGGNGYPTSGEIIGTMTVPADQVSNPPLLPQQTVYTAFTFFPCLNFTANTNYQLVLIRAQPGGPGNYFSQISNLIWYPETKFWTYVPINGFWQEKFPYMPALRLEGPEPDKPPVLIIPGIGGSELYNGDDLIWADLEEMFWNLDGDQFLTENLLLNEGGDSIRQINVGEAILSIDDEVITGLPIINIFKSLKSELESNGYNNQNLFFSPYDWRLNLDNSKDLLNSKIEEIKVQTGADKINIIAHSMGGLLAKDYINTYGKDSIDKLIFVGTPHLGAPKAGKVLLAGDNLGIPWLEKERIKEIAENSPALYQLLPNQKYFDSFPGYIKKFDMEELLDYQGTKDFLISQTYNSNVMGLSEVFRDKNLEDIDLSGIKVYNFTGCDSGTQAAYILEPGNFIGQILYTSGDGTVPFVSADYTGSSDISKFYYKNGHHSELPSEKEIRGAILNILSDTPVEAVDNLSLDQSICEINGKQLAFHSPVSVHIYDSQNRHTGPIENNGIEYGVPGIDYEIIDHDKFVFLPTDSGETYNIIADSLATGSFDLLISENHNGIIEGTTVFNDVPIGELGDVSFSVSDSSLDSVINVDYYGNDIVNNVSASAVLSGNEGLDVISPETDSVISGQAGSSGWYLGNIAVELSASDDNSGILETRYSIDGRPFEVYELPIIVTDEGMHTILYYSVDRAGNNEETKSLSFGIDMTGLEIAVRFDIDSESFSFMPVGDSLETISFSCDSASCTAVDQAGNTTKLKLTFEENGRKEILNFNSVSYNGIEYEIQDSQFAVRLWEKNNELRDFDQGLLIQQEEKLRIDYKIKRDESVIVHKIVSEKVTREVVSGKRFLQIFTDKGKIDYIIL